MESIREVVARNAKRLLDSSDLRLKEIARLTGVSTTTVSRWKSGIHPPEIENLEKLAKVINVNPWEFYKTEEVKRSFSTSKTLEKLASIPDKIYDLAFSFDATEEDWEVIETFLEDAKKRSERRRADQAQA